MLLKLKNDHIYIFHLHLKLHYIHINNYYIVDIANDFGCCVDIVSDIAKDNHIEIKNKAQEEMKKTSKQIAAYSKNNEFIKSFSSTVEAAKWCYETGKSSTLNSGVRGHIADVANGKRKSAYSYIWKYIT